MTTISSIQDFLAQKRIAIVGVSRDPKDFSRSLFREFQSRGYDVVPVNPQATDIEGQSCATDVRSIRPPVDGVLLMTSPDATDHVVKDCADAGIKRVWMYRAGGKGAVSPRAIEFCQAHGISVVAGECPFMFFEGGSWFHRFHGFVRKITGSYPT